MGEADEELRVAISLHRDESLPARAACFHAHLAAEKALKGLLIERSIVLPRVHDLLALHAMLAIDDQQLFTAADLDALNPWTLEGRYPSDMADAAAARVGGLLDAASRVVSSAAREMESSS
jgi:HEPN domain-containing protein